MIKGGKKGFEGLFFTKAPATLNLKAVETTVAKLYRKKPVPEIINEKELFEIANNVPLMSTRVFIFIAFLTAGRRGEVTKLLKRDIKFVKINNKPFGLFHMVNLKNRSKPFKDIPVALDTPEKINMFEQIMRYGHYLNNYELYFKGISKEAQSMRVKRALTIINHRFYDFNKKDYVYMDFRVYPHFLRHLRLSHLVRDYKIDPFSLQAIAGWGDVRMAQVYVSTSWSQITSLMMNKFIPE